MCAKLLSFHRTNCCEWRPRVVLEADALRVRQDSRLILFLFWVHAACTGVMLAVMTVSKQHRPA